MAALRGQCRDDDVHVWRKVREVRLEDYVGPVYDLTVEGDHSYVAEGVGVHNCTGNAAVGCIATGPFFATLDSVELTRYPLDEGTAVSVYSAATAVDPYAGSYPPEDTGSDGLSVAKVLKSAGLISGYTHAFSLTDALAGLMRTPFITGVEWTSDMFNPDTEGIVHPTGSVAGGHEFVGDGYDDARGLVWFTNSWGAGWSLAGRFAMPAEEFGGLLQRNGDVTFFVPSTLPAPDPEPVDPPDVHVDQADLALATAVAGWARKVHPARCLSARKAVRTWLDVKGL